MAKLGHSGGRDEDQYMARGLNFAAPEPPIAARNQQLGLGLFIWLSLGAASLAGLAPLILSRL
jgi:hypothetical protein